MELWRKVPEGARETVPGGRCPRCASNRVHRSRTRGPLEVLLRAVTPIRAFKCAACRWRGWRIPQQSEAPSLDVHHERARTRPQLDHMGRVLLSPEEARRRRRRAQILVALICALVITAVFLGNQETFGAIEPQP